MLPIRMSPIGVCTGVPMHEGMAVLWGGCRNEMWGALCMGVGGALGWSALASRMHCCHCEGFLLSFPFGFCLFSAVLPTSNEHCCEDHKHEEEQSDATYDYVYCGLA